MRQIKGSTLQIKVEDGENVRVKISIAGKKENPREHCQLLFPRVHHILSDGFTPF